MKNHGRFLKPLGLFITTWLFSLPTIAQPTADFVAGEYVVRLKNGASPQVLNQNSNLAAGWGLSSSTKIKTVLSQKMNTVLVERSMLERADAVISELKNNPMVEIVEPNYIYYASQLPNDSKLDDLWGLINKSKSSGGVDINARDAWAIQKGQSDVVVAVIDTGVNYNHPDLKNNMWVNEAEANGVDGVDDDGNGYIDDIHGYDFANDDADPMDDNNHGSHCAGTIGAEGDNGIGVVGVNWDVSIMALKFLSGTGGGTLDAAIKAIDYATEKKVDIMSNSWGGGGFSQTLKEAIERAEQQGILFVAAAGNDGKDNDSSASYPANYEVANVLSVAAIGEQGRLARFSNYGKNTVHIAAPGVNIMSTGQSGYLSLSGTSMATPHVSGVAALLVANEPGISYQEIRSRLLETSVPMSSLNNKVEYGLLNAFNALTNTIPPPDENDPAPWPFVQAAESSPHPYVNDFDNSWTLTVPGAEKVAVHFDRFETENGYDKVEFYDSQGNKVGEMTGANNDSMSPVAVGESITVRLVTDYSVTSYGFDIDRIHYKEVEPSVVASAPKNSHH